LRFNTGLKLRQFREIVLLATRNDAMQFNTEHDLSFLGKGRKNEKETKENCRQSADLIWFHHGHLFFLGKKLPLPNPFLVTISNSIEFE
jgi:hypothetical protein